MAYDADPTKRKEDGEEAPGESQYAALLTGGGGATAPAAGGGGTPAQAAPKSSTVPGFVNFDRYVSANKGTTDRLANEIKGRERNYGADATALQAGVLKDATAGATTPGVTTGTHITGTTADVQNTALANSGPTSDGFVTGRQGIIKGPHGSGNAPTPPGAPPPGAPPPVSSPASGLTQTGDTDYTRDQAVDFSDNTYTGPLVADLGSRYASLLDRSGKMSGLATAAKAGDYSSIVPGANAFDSKLLGTTNAGQVLQDRAAAMKKQYDAAYGQSTADVTKAYNDTNENVSQWNTLLDGYDADVATAEGIKTAHATKDHDAKVTDLLGFTDTFFNKDPGAFVQGGDQMGLGGNPLKAGIQNFTPAAIKDLAEAARSGDYGKVLRKFTEFYQFFNPGQPVPDVIHSSSLFV